jgi:hypothetical protein
MKSFAILREIPPTLTWDEVDSSAVQNIINMGLTDITPEIAWDPRVVGVKWVRSYWAPGTDWGLCLYTADSAENVKAWHDECGVAYAGIQEVEELAPGGEVPYDPGFHKDPDASRLVALEGHADAMFQEALPPEVAANATWIRAYVDRATDQVYALFRADHLPDAATFDALAQAGWKARRVVEIKPGDYIEG